VPTTNKQGRTMRAPPPPPPPRGMLRRLAFGLMPALMATVLLLYVEQSLMVISPRSRGVARGGAKGPETQVIYTPANHPVEPSPKQRITRPLKPVQKRSGLGAMLEEEGMRVGAELGVHRGSFANMTLTAWKRCKRYYAIDVW
jgi:hypothetical protein